MAHFKVLQLRGSRCEGFILFSSRFSLCPGSRCAFYSSFGPATSSLLLLLPTLSSVINPRRPSASPPPPPLRTVTTKGSLNLHPYAQHLINNCIINPVCLCSVCVCVCVSKHMHVFCLEVVVRVSEYYKWKDGDNRGERGREGARLHLISFLILCDDAAQTVVSKYCLLGVCLDFYC